MTSFIQLPRIGVNCVISLNISLYIETIISISLLNIKDYNELYKFLLTPKNYRNEIKEVDFNFTYNFDQRIAELKDIKIDNKINQSVNKILNNVVFKNKDLQNKIYFKNLLNDAIKNYSGQIIFLGSTIIL